MRRIILTTAMTLAILGFVAADAAPAQAQVVLNAGFSQGYYGGYTPYYGGYGTGVIASPGVGLSLGYSNYGTYGYAPYYGGAYYGTGYYGGGSSALHAYNSFYRRAGYGGGYGVYNGYRRR